MVGENRKRTLIIAEAGVNHNGDVKIAKQLIDKAKEAGADIVKFQTTTVSGVVSKYAEMAEYQKVNLGFEKSQKEMLEAFTLPFDAFYEIADYCREKDIAFLSTPFDLASVDFLEQLGCRMWKIPSGEITNYPYLVKIAKTKKPVILSTGMSTLEEVRDCYELLKQNGTPEISLLHCTTQYPTEYGDVNLRAMITLKEAFGCPVGYSDHTRGIEVPVAAVAMGAEIIEKHFTLSRDMEGPDHKASLEPDELIQMVSMVRHIEEALGNGVKVPSQAERPNMLIARKSIVAKRRIEKGEILSEENLTTKRPGGGVNPMLWNQVIGTKAVDSFEEDELIKL